MEAIVCQLTMLFEDPFWVGVFERVDGRRHEAARIVFGAEPKDYEVYELVLRRWDSLRFSPPVAADEKPPARPSPKRMQRAITRALRPSGVGTRAQQALALAREQSKQERKSTARENRAAAADRMRELRRQKQKEKHRGH